MIDTQNPKPLFIFSQELEKGQSGEELFYYCFRDKIGRTDGLSGDFYHKTDDYLIELKSEYYDLNKTRNFFIERFSNKEKQTPGGPWQALQNGSKKYIHFFVINGILFTFETENLVNYLDEHFHLFKLKEIPNKTWVTVGFTIPREQLKHLYSEYLIKDFDLKRKECFGL